MRIKDTPEVVLCFILGNMFLLYVVFIIIIGCVEIIFTNKEKE